MPTIKQSLLALAVAGTMAISNTASAVALAANDIWADSSVTGEGTTIAAPGNAMAVEVGAHTLTINDVGDALAVGAITGASGVDGDVTVTTATLGAAVSATIASIDMEGTANGDGDILITSLNADNAATVNLTVTGVLDTTNGDVALTNLEASVDSALTVSVGSTFKAVLVTVTGAAGDGTGGSSSTLTLTGPTATATSYTLDDATAATVGIATLGFNGTVAQTVVGNVAAAADGEGVVTITNTHASGVTFNDDLGVAATGLGSISVASGSKLTQKALIAGDALTFDVVGNVDDGSAGRGGTLVVGGGAAVSGTAGDAITLMTITGNTKLTALTIEGGAGTENDAGGAITSSVLVGTTDVTTYTMTGGAAGGNDAATGGVGGAIATHLQTGATTAWCWWCW